MNDTTDIDTDAKPAMKRLAVSKAATIRLTALCTCPYHISWL